MNYPFRFLMALLVIAISAFPSDLSAAVVTNVSNVAELVGALEYCNTLGSSIEKTVILAKGEYDVSECAMTCKYGTSDLVDKNTHLALHRITLVGESDNPRDTVIYGGGEVKKRGVICGSYSTVRNITISNGWSTTSGGGYRGYYSATPGSLMREIVSNCVVTCCYAEGNWGGGSAISGVKALDSELCHNKIGIAQSNHKCFGAADRCDLYRCVIHSNHSDSYGGGLGQCYAYDCVISNNTSRSGGAGMGIVAGSYIYLLSGCKVVNNHSSGFGGGIYAEGAAVGVVTNTLIAENSGTGGGGVYGAFCTYSAISNNYAIPNSSSNSYGGGTYGARLENCDICYNYLQGCDGMTNAYGGAAYASALTGCNVFANAIFGGGVNMQGAGLYGGGATNCVIYENFIDASGLGAAMNAGCAYGCVFSNNQTRATNRDCPQVRQPAGPVVNCKFHGQSIACSTKVVVENCRFTGCRDGWTIPAGHNIASMTEDLTSDIPGSDYLASAYMHMRNCLIDNNSIKYISRANSSDLTTFENCTFADNCVNQIFYKYCGESFLTNAASVVNCIFTGNYDKTGTTRCDLSFKEGTNVSLENCLVGTSRSDGVLYSETGTVTADNVCFNRKNPAHPYEPKYSSPARGAGKPLDWMTADATDIRADPAYPRLREGKVDIGCYQCWLDPVGFVMSVK